ncbi:MAG: MBL fold metallo-hydrolase [Omnitrophica WOR_2 bacterium]
MLKSSAFGHVTRFDLARTLAGRGRYWTTCYLVDGILIDTGCAYARQELVKALDGVSLEKIINTHTHEDHIGSNGVLQTQYPRIEILAHPQALPVLAEPRKTQRLHPYRRLFWGWPDRSIGKAIQEGDQVESEHYKFHVLYTPGHAPDHLCFFEEKEGWLFSGDLYVGGRDRALRAGYDIRQIIISLKRIADLPIQVLFPGSARVRENPVQELRAKISYLEEMGEKVTALHNQGTSIHEIARILFGEPMWIEYITLGHFSRQRLVLSYLGINFD